MSKETDLVNSTDSKLEQSDRKVSQSQQVVIPSQEDQRKIVPSNPFKQTVMLTGKLKPTSNSLI